MSSRVLSLAVGGLWVASFLRIAFLVEKAATQSMFDSCEIGTLRALGLVCSWSLLNMIGLRSSEACLVGRVFSALSWLSDLRFGNGLGFVCSWLLIALLISWVRSDMGGLSWGFYMVNCVCWCQWKLCKMFTNVDYFQCVGLMLQLGRRG